MIMIMIVTITIHLRPSPVNENIPNKEHWRSNTTVSVTTIKPLRTKNGLLVKKQKQKVLKQNSAKLKRKLLTADGVVPAQIA